MGKIAVRMLVAAAMTFGLGTSAWAQSCGNNGAGFEQWKREFAGQARAQGVGPKGLSALAGAKYATATIRADRAVRSAFKGNVQSFMQRRGGPVIVQRGKQLKRQNAALFADIERRYGVPAGVILAIWGMETGFGRVMGNQNTIDAITTLAYDCRRPAFFTPHAIGALKLVDSGSLTSRSVGAMHGEIGHTQFLPGNVIRYGVGSKNLRDRNTALASTANFLKGHGWQRGASIRANAGAIAGWNAASVYQQAIIIMGEQIEGE